MDITGLCFPGVFSIECVPTGRTFFGETQEETFFYIKDFLDDLERGYSDNEQLLADYKKYGRDNFKVDILAIGPEYQDSKLRLETFEKYKRSWPGDLY